MVNLPRSMVVAWFSISLATTGCSTDTKTRAADTKTNSADQVGNGAGSGTQAATPPPSPVSPSPAPMPNAQPSVTNSAGTGASAGGLSSLLGGSGLSAAQLGQFLSTPAGAAIFKQILTNPAIATATGVPEPILTAAASNPQLVASLLQSPQVSSAIDQALGKLISQDPTLLPKIISSLGSATTTTNPATVTPTKT